jgi:hypothetical protein
LTKVLANCDPLRQYQAPFRRTIVSNQHTKSFQLAQDPNSYCRKTKNRGLTTQTQWHAQDEIAGSMRRSANKVLELVTQGIECKEGPRLRKSNWSKNTFRRFLDSTTKRVREVQILDSAANRTTSVPDPSSLTAITIGLLSLDPLRSPLLSQGLRQIHGTLQSIRESHPVQKMRRL